MLAQSLGVFIETPTAKTYTLDLDAGGPYIISKLKIQTRAGTCTVALTYNGSAISGAGSIAVSSTPTTVTLNQAVAVDDTIALVVSSATTPADLSASIQLNYNSIATVSDTPPTLAQGAIWFDSTNLQTNIGYNDGNSIQWTVANAAGPGPTLPLTIAQGGTGATTASAALTNLGAAPATGGSYVSKAGDTMSGDLAISTSGWSAVNLTVTTGNRNQINGFVGTHQRWEIDLGDGTSESGSNAGSNFGIVRYNDAGIGIDYPLTINRATAAATFSGTVAATGVVGVTNGSNAAAGTVGEFLTANVASGVSLPNNTATNITSLALTAGDWDVYGSIIFNPSGAVGQNFGGAINTVSATLPTGFMNINNGSNTMGNPTVLPVNFTRINISSTTTIYLVAQVSLASGTCTGGGNIWARRAR